MPDFVQAKALTAVEFTLDATAPTTPVASSLAPVDGAFLIDQLLSTDECDRLVAAAEKSGGFAFWDPDGGEARRSVRNADTLELADPEFCAALWARLCWASFSMVYHGGQIS